MGWRCAQQLAIAAMAVHIAACSFGAYPQRRARPASVWRDTAYAGSCNPSAPGRDMVGAIITGAMTILGLLTYASGARAHNSIEVRSRVALGVVIGAPSAILFVPYSLGALHGSHRSKACLAERAKPVLDARAVDFTASARALAERGDCPGANRLAEKARHADERYFRLVTAVDPNIRRCLDAPAVPGQSMTGPGQP